MSFVDELERLERLRQQGLLSDAELERAKAKLLDQSGSSLDSAEQMQLSGLKVELVLARLDQAWKYEKERYMVQMKYGGSRFPSVFIGVINIVLGVGMGGFLLWLRFTMYSSYGVPNDSFSWILPLAGLFFIFGGLWAGIDECNKATEYSSREQAYHRQRDQIIRRSS